MIPSIDNLSTQPSRADIKIKLTSTEKICLYGKILGLVLGFFLTIPAYVISTNARSCVNNIFEQVRTGEKKISALRSTVEQQSQLVIQKASFEIVKSPLAIFIIGGSGSGKSSLRQDILQKAKRKFTVIDLDLIKETMPKYQELLIKKVSKAAEEVHQESQSLRQGLFDRTIKLKEDLIFDGTGALLEPNKEWIASCKAVGYRVELYYVETSLEICKARAQKRGEKTGRFVPEYAIDYTNEQSKCNFPTFQKLVHAWKHFTNNDNLQLLSQSN